MRLPSSILASLLLTKTFKKWCSRTGIFPTFLPLLHPLPYNTLPPKLGINQNVSKFYDQVAVGKVTYFPGLKAWPLSFNPCQPLWFKADSLRDLFMWFKDYDWDANISWWLFFFFFEITKFYLHLFPFNISHLQDSDDSLECHQRIPIAEQSVVCSTAGALIRLKKTSVTITCLVTWISTRIGLDIIQITNIWTVFLVGELSIHKTIMFSWLIPDRLSKVFTM